MFEFIYDISQSGRISQANNTADSARHLATRAESETHRLTNKVAALEQQTERLSLTLMAMAEILSQYPGITAEALEAKVREIDLRDGKLDGRLQRPAKLCDKCLRASHPSRKNCLYCGEPLPQDSTLFPSELSS